LSSNSNMSSELGPSWAHWAGGLVGLFSYFFSPPPLRDFPNTGY
jgi:hypothetical protein